MKKFKIGDLVFIGEGRVGRITELDVSDGFSGWSYGVTTVFPDDSVNHGTHISGRGWGYHEDTLSPATEKDLQILRVTAVLTSTKKVTL